MRVKVGAAATTEELVAVASIVSRLGQVHSGSVEAVPVRISAITLVSSVTPDPVTQISGLITSIDAITVVGATSIDVAT